MADRKHRDHHLWPEWWDDVPHPDVPFPKFGKDRHVLLGNPPTPEEILEAAEQYAQEHGEGYDYHNPLPKSQDPPLRALEP